MPEEDEDSPRPVVEYYEDKYAEMARHEAEVAKKRIEPSFMGRLRSRPSKRRRE